MFSLVSGIILQSVSAFQTTESEGREQQEQEEKEAGIRGEVKENGWGSQIRSYVLQPYTMVKDLRTGEESGNAQAVLDGKLDPFMSAYLKWKKTGIRSGDVTDAE